MASPQREVIPGVVYPGELTELQSLYVSVCEELGAAPGTAIAISAAKGLMDAYTAGIRDKYILARMASMHGTEVPGIFTNR